MKSFLKFTFASVLGFFLSFVLLFALFAIIIGVASSMSDKEVKIKDQSILKLNLNAPILDHTDDNPLENFDFGSFTVKNNIGLDDLLDNIKKAKADDKIKGIYLELSMIQTGFANLKEIRDAIVNFQDSGKFVVAYSEGYSQASYYLASAASEIHLFPEGEFDLRGLYTELAFFKGALDKLGVDAQVFRGPGNNYKSAVEPFMYDKMSESSKEQVGRFLDVFWDEWLNDVAASRSLSKEKLTIWAENLRVKMATDALELGLVDKLSYSKDVEASLKEKSDKGEKDKLEFVSLSKYKDVKDLSKDKQWTLKDKLAVIYAEGPIVSGKGEAAEIGSSTLTEQINKAAEDSSIKAIVLRVNSPGGSALASEVIWKATQEAKIKKPFVVSMGNLAASGGYYISCGADRIFADVNTITGSIGVFAMIPNTSKLMNDKLGITFDGVKTNENADLISITKPISEMGRQYIQEGIDHIYNLFIQRVAEGRGLSKETADSLARGRVWAGRDAFENKLVDEIGGLERSIEYAAEIAGLDQYKLKVYPESKDPFESIMLELAGEVRMSIVEDVLGDEFRTYQQINSIRKMEGYQARLPFEFHVW